MTVKRKYTSYKVSITKTNGFSEDINMKGINNTSYKDMLEVYNSIKEQYANRSCIIEFIGVNGKDEEMKVIFSKSINIENNEEKIKIKAKDMAKEINKLLDDTKKLIKNNKKQNAKLLGGTNKKLDMNLHTMQSNKLNKIHETNEEKLNRYDEISILRIDRMNYKNEISELNILKNILDSTEQLQKDLKDFIKSKHKKINFSEESLKEYYIIKEEFYKTDKQRIKLMSEWENKYKKVVVDEVNKKIIAYNLGYDSEKNRKKVG